MTHFPLHRWLAALAVMAAAMSPLPALPGAGTLDPGFNSGSPALFGMGHGPDFLASMVRLPDGRLLLAGTSIIDGVSNAVLAMHFDTGDTDFSFGNNGIVTLPLPAFNFGVAISGVAVDSAGRIVVSGSGSSGTLLAGPIGTLLAIRFLSDGTLDTTFGGAGVRGLSNGVGRPNRGYAVAVDASDRVYVAGIWITGALPNLNEMAVWRINTDGTDDATFGASGIPGLALTGFGINSDTAYAMKIDGSGRIVIAGSTDDGVQVNMAIARLLATTGAPDPTFGDLASGRKQVIVPGANTTIRGIDFDSLGRIVFAGSIVAGQRHVLAGRFTTVGQPDITFNLTGFGTYAVLAEDEAFAVAAGPGDRILAVGRVLGGVTRDRPLAVSILPGGIFDPLFGLLGAVYLDVGVGQQAAAVATSPTTLYMAGSTGIEGNPDFVLFPLDITTGAGVQGYLDDIADGTTEGSGIARDAQGRLVIAGSVFDGYTKWFGIARYLPDGTPDTTFGAKGVRTNKLSAGDDEAFGVAVDASGNYVLVGNAGADSIALMRLNAFGIPDNAFGASGRLTIPIAGATQVIFHSIAILPDGRILAGGTAFVSGAFLAVVVRLLADGSPDTSFSANGIRTYSPIGTSVIASQMILQADGSIMLVGTALIAGTPTFAVARLTSAGALDSTFGSIGVATFNLSPTGSNGTAIAQLPDGRYVVGGFADSAGFNKIAVMRLLSNGALDATFASAGVANLSISTGSDEIYDLLVQSDGNIVVAGSANGSTAMAIARFDANGSLDTTYGGVGTGYATFTVGGGTHQARKMAFDFATEDAFVAGTIGLKAVLLRVLSLQDNVPDTFGFPTQTGVPASATITSAPTTITGLGLRAPITVSTGQYSIGCTGTFTTAGSFIEPGQSVCVRHTSSASPGGNVTTTLAINGVSGTFSSIATGSVPTSLSNLTGGGQSAAIGAAFSGPITVTVRDATNAPMAGVPVTFTAPAFGASATLTPPTAITNASGVASVNATANNQYGTYTVNASVAGIATPATFTLTNLGAGVGLTATQIGFGNKDINLTWNAPTVTLTSVGNVPLASIAITATGAGFSVANNTCPATLAVNTSCTFVPRFIPTTEGNRTGQITVVSNAFASPTTILLAGNGIDLTNPLGDADGDGVPNGIEPTVNLDPRNKDNDIYNSPRLFAMQQYRDFLGREGDNGGVDFWIAQLNTGAQTRGQMIENFFGSAEFQGVGAPVARLYFAYFLRIPDYGGLTFWIGYSRTGHALSEISQAFATSQEFVNRYGALTNDQFVDLVYQNVLGRPADAGGKTFWLGQLNGGMTRGAMMIGFSESAEFQAKIFNGVYVTMMYVGMLRRSPDQGGYDFWTNYIQQGNSGLALINGFVVAPEYRSRFLP